MTEEVKDAAGEDDYSYSFAGERRLKGVNDPQKLFRARRFRVTIKGDPPMI